MSDELLAKTYLKTYNTYNRQTSMFSEGFETAIPASEWPQTQALYRTATEILPNTSANSITISKLLKTV
jgi:hypothetical protein